MRRKRTKSDRVAAMHRRWIFQWRVSCPAIRRDQAFCTEAAALKASSAIEDARGVPCTVTPERLDGGA